MNSLKRLQKIAIKLAICDINEEIDSSVAQDVQDEIFARPHLTQVTTYHDVDLRQVVVNVVIKSVSEDMAQKQLADEFFEIANAVLRHIDGVHIKILDSTLVK
jgi:malate/lactate dehydrogenase